jgi:alpha-galactosidase
MAADMEALCPDVWFLNYTNPMAINCRALNRATKVRTVGLCHSVQGTAFVLSLDLGIPFTEITYLAAGINHMAFYLQFERDGEDLYPRLREKAERGDVGP